MLAYQFPILYRIEADVISQRNCTLQPNFDKIHNGLQRECLTVHYQFCRHVAGQHVHNADRKVRCFLWYCQGHFSGGKVCEAKCTGTVISVIQGTDIVIGIIFQHAALDQRTRRNNTNDITFYQAFAQCWICHLLANCDLVSLIHQTFQIEFYTVIRYAAHGSPFFQTALFSGQCQFQLSGNQNSIFEKHFIKVAQSEKHDTVTVFFFGRCILLHHRRKFFSGDIC